MNIFAKSLLVITVAAVVSGCVQHRYPTEVKNELDDAIASNPDKLPADVAAEMSVGQSVGTNSGIYAPTRRFRVQAENVDAKEFFASLLNETSYGIVVHPDVAGTISLDLQNVTIGEVLNAISSIYGYDIQQKGKIFYVYPAGVRTETFSVDYLLVKRSGLASLNITTGGVSSKDSNSNSDSSSSSSNSSDDSSSDKSFDSDSGTSVITSTANDFWTSLEKAITNFIGKGNGKSVIVSPEAGLVVVSANPSELKAVKTFLDSAQQRLTKQILLEAKVLEVRLADEFQAGIDWSILGSSKHWRSDIWRDGDSGRKDWSSYVGRTGVVDGITHIVFRDSEHFNLGVAVNLLQEQGDVSILSSPRITTSNNQKAVIKVGSDEYYVTGVESNTNTVTSSTGTITGTISNPTFEYTPFFSGVSLDVTPQIKDDGSVLMHIHPAVIKVEEQVKTIVYNGQTSSLPMAKSTIRETDTVVQANSGDVIVIGGLIEERKVDETSKVPLLGDIPYIGNLFKSTDKVTEKVELVILIRPIVAGGETWKNELRRSNELLEKWYPSGLQKLD